MIKINRIIQFLLVFLIVNILMVNFSYALVAGPSGGGSSSSSGSGSGSSSGSGGASTELGDLNSYAQDPASDPTEFRQKANKVIGIIQVCGSIFSVIALIAIGIRYMFSSIEEKAEYKKTMMGYIIGCVMVFCLTNILAFVYDLANP